MDDKRKWLTDLITNFLANSPDNRMGSAFGEEKIWDAPLVKFASGADKLFGQFKTPEVCGEQHWLPVEAFAKFYPDENCLAEELTVVSWILPQTKASKDSLLQETRYPSERWARARVFGEKVNDMVRRHVVDSLAAIDVRGCAPMLHPEWTRLQNVQRVFSSKWSERHAAYAAGHGTFGLCDALITEVGKAHRTGTVIMKLKLPPSERAYTGIYDYCLYHSKGTCGLCADNCPYGAISRESGHDKKKCFEFLHVQSPAYVKEHFGFDGYGCGFCQVGVPCADRIPGR
jgi:epoxyqueuosine reductase QueG